jgi:hypothetical protein
MKVPTGPFFTRFPRSDGHAKYISSPTLSLAGFMIPGIDVLLFVYAMEATGGIFKAPS